MDNKQPLAAVDRTLKILEHVARHEKINLEHLAAETNLPKPTLHRFLATLVDLGYVYRDENNQYSLTLRMFSIGSQGLEQRNLLQDARPIAMRLSQQLQETVHMGVLDGTMAVYVLKIESPYTIRMYSRVGKRIPLYCTAIGKVLLAHLSAEVINSLELIPYTAATITDTQRLQEELSAVRIQGYAQDNQEYEEGVCCIASPVYDYTSSVIAALSVSWPTFRYTEKHKDTYICSIKESASAISSLLGFLSR